MSAAAVTVARPARALAWANRGATVALVAVLAVLALGIGLRAAGIVPLVAYSGSMAPAIEAGDVVVVRSAVAGELVPGQVATLSDPVSGRLITHRVASVADEGGGRVAVVTRGDANDASERWVLQSDASVQRMVGRVPDAGYPLLWLSSPQLRLLLAALGAGLLVAALLRRRTGKVA